ncbi:MAG: hypothetical protein UR90_C0012G0007 [Parcubacteria group bacterium GW2011_GWC1_35_8]|uniref:Uncharacterized protein n=2 Tax=Candidatus Nomuraibacteriota TaxID=1752729 RepID=A0A1F6YVF9_9BACT|nr:MAG: hypothetical protein UR90_C0012G0007 [Parcubacteria group bacterium GW2011_GWC1_35_8]KKP89327.1 MAG: hypothetical protein UR91_C0004G0021 [Candidatus Nomurabacteria bacterium GW2011_GWC2_35_8]OGJ10381.1 MAG: hypothetical protein A2456_02015 [Candidatus Nomurabacteria bacterium RIFOXYC2_FULL_36_19]OGJ14642.1 MAG: hypothetical protein A2554_02610 [Candidatus Nomurabacteria bacterium RIFOXYD2_FULL_35_12]
MINLIPNKERKEINKCFYYRLVVLFLVISIFSFFVFFIAILPSYFLSSVKNSIVDVKLEAQKNEIVPLPDQKTLLIIKDLNKKLYLILNTENEKFIVSQKVINAIILKKMFNIKINNISYEENTSLQDRKISIEGSAPSREVLLSFRQALEDDANFKQVNLPISNFVKGSNIQFYLSLIPS